MEYLDWLTNIVDTIQVQAYSSFETIARQSMDRRDKDDWPILAAALALGAPSGSRTPTSSVAASPRGLPTESSCSCLSLSHHFRCRLS